MTTQLVRAGLATMLTLSLVNCSESEKKPTGGGDKPDAASAKTLRFSAIPDSDTTAQKEKYQVLADYLDTALGDDVKVEFVPAADYPASVEKFGNGDIQLAWFGGVTGVQARESVEGSTAIAAGKEDLQYKSYFIANADTGLTKSDEFPKGIADLTFTFGSPSSTSGGVMPAHFIIENTGKKPAEFFSKPVGYSGAHDKTASEVEAGTYQVGALNYGTYDQMVADGKLDSAKAVIIWETPTYPDYNFTVHPDLGEELIKKLQDALLAIDGETDQEKEILKILNRTSIVKVTNADFEAIAKVLKALEE